MQSLNKIKYYKINNYITITISQVHKKLEYWKKEKQLKWEKYIFKCTQRSILKVQGSFN